MHRMSVIIQSPELIRLKVEGKLVESGIGEFLGACQRVQRLSAKFELDLANLQFVDVAAVFALHGLQRDGATIVASSPFVDALLKTTGSDHQNGTAPQS